MQAKWRHLGGEVVEEADEAKGAAETIEAVEVEIRVLAVAEPQASQGSQDSQANRGHSARGMQTTLQKMHATNITPSVGGHSIAGSHLNVRG